MRRVPFALAVACLVALVPLSSSLGHAELKTAAPGPGDKISELPAKLVARFTQDLRPNRTSIELRNADGKRIAEGGKDPDKARVQRLSLPTLEPGKYEVRWVTFSAEDDEIARGKYRFTVQAPAATPASSPAGVDCTTPDESPAPDSSAEPKPSVAPTPAATMAPEASGTPDSSSDPDASPTADASPDPCVATSEDSAESDDPADATGDVEASPAP